MEIKTFDDAVAFVGMARMLREDLPDGQWEDLKDIITDFKEVGRTMSDWSEDTKQAFTEAVAENYNYWI